MRAPLLRWCLGAIGLALLALLALLYTPPGLRLAGRLAGPLSGGQVRVEGLGGFFPNHLHAARLEVADSDGVWLRIEQASLSWSALALLGNHVSVGDIAAARVTVLRRPIPSGASSGTTPRIDIGHLSLPRLDLAAPVIGRAVTLTAAGSLHYVSRHQVEADLLVTRLGSSDRYRVAGGIAADIAHGSVGISEGADGILGKLINLPGLGPVNLSARASGDAAANQLAFQLSAGPLRADGHGVIALASRHADLDITLNAPAMTPRPGMAWQAVSGEAHVHGGFDAPLVDAHLVLTNGTVQGVTAKSLTLDVTGSLGRVQLKGVAEGVALPGMPPGLFAKAPLLLSADADLRDRVRPVRFSLHHPLARLDGLVETQGPLAVTADLAVPSLAPFAALAKADLAGQASLHATLRQQDARLQVALDGRLDTRGKAMLARMLGKTRLTMTALVDGADMEQSHIQLQAAGFSADVSGSLRRSVLDYRLALNLRDLSRLVKTVPGSLSLQGRVHGPMGEASLSADGAALLTMPGFGRQRVAISLKANGLPELKNATLALNGRLRDAPLSLRAALDGGKTRHAKLTAHWRSLEAQADIAIGANAALDGKAHLALRQLADIADFTGMALSGAADANVRLRTQGGKTDAAVTVAANNLRLDMGSLESASLTGAVTDVLGKPQLDLALGLHKIAAQGWTGETQAQLRGPLDGIGITLNANLQDAAAHPLKANAAASLSLPHKQLTLAALDGTWRGLALKLDAPATLAFADGLAVDHLAAHLGKGTLRLAGRLTPALALTASANGIALADFRAFQPELGPQGTLTAEAELHGTLAAPTGRVALRARDLRTSLAPSGVPSGTVSVNAQLLGDHATIAASADAGASAHIALTGSAPLQAGGTMALHVAGKADLALLDAVTLASGRRLRGALTLEGDAAGTLAAPRLTGRGSLTGGDIQDFAQGLRVHDIEAAFVADGTKLTLTKFTGRAGPGTLSASGGIDLAAPGMPIDIRLEAKDARPIASNLMTASLSGTMALTGGVKSGMTLTGKAQVTSGEINLPDNFPPDVAVLNVRHRGQPPPPPPPRQTSVKLDLAVRTTGPVFVRGHGMDAEMGGAIQVSGTTGAPVVAGGLQLTRGTYTVAGQTLDFTSGRIRFDGTGVRGRLDPSLDFTAQTVSGGVTATLAITGYASAPKIALSSTPQLPQDEIVAHLLFQQSVKQLTPLQLASIAQAAAAMGGIGGGFNPLGTVRRTLGLDRLSVGSVQGGASGTQSQTTVEAGRYVTHNVYVGVKQNLSGGTQTQVQVDITRRLKAQATLSTGASTATTQGNALQDNGSSVGLSYQFEY